VDPELRPLKFEDDDTPEKGLSEELEDWSEGYLDEDDVRLMRRYVDLASRYE